jgi:hypothetical protein
MLKQVLGATIGVCMGTTPVCGQGFSHIDTLKSSNTFSLYEYHVEVPLGQTFVKSGDCQRFSTVRFHVPESKNRPSFSLDTIGSKIRPMIVMGSPGTCSKKTTMAMRGAATMTVSRTTSVTIDDDPQRYLMELRGDPTVPTKLVLGLGYGSAWLDLSAMDMRAVEIQSGNADVFVTYKTPNTHPMGMLQINGGMSKIVVRNLEMARAENVVLENGMGNTKVIVGQKAYHKGNVSLNVGTGNCHLLIHQDHPVKIIIGSSMLSTVEIPADMIETTENTFVNLAYKANPQNAMTFMVDVSMGSFFVVTYE